MFDYCVQALHLSEAEAYLRIRAARLTRHKSKRQLELLLAQRFEKPDVSTSIRALPEKRPPDRLVPERATDQEQPLFAATASFPNSSPPPTDTSEPAPSQAPQPQPSIAPPATPPALTPLGPKRFKLQLTAHQALHDKLRQAQHLMRRELPDGDLASVLERALDLLIAERMKRRFATTDKPRIRRDQPPTKAVSRHIPHEVRRQVLARDGARCTFLSADGKRCDQRALLELHHEQPFGRGGPATVANIRVLCSAHNQLLAERDYGQAFMRDRVDRAKSERGGSAGRKPSS